MSRTLMNIQMSIKLLQLYGDRVKVMKNLKVPLIFHHTLDLEIIMQKRQNDSTDAEDILMFWR